MTARRLRALVTGADQHQGLAVIRGLGRAGVDVVAAGPHANSLGFHSRYATDRALYRPPREMPEAFVSDVALAVQRTGADVIVPAVESTLAALVERRAEVERFATLAVPPSPVVRYALDKRAMLSLAATLGVPVPVWGSGWNVDALMDRARSMRPPYVIKPRGHASQLAIPDGLDFKVRYARTLDELYRILNPLAEHAEKLLVQEYVPGIGRCVASVWRRGKPIAMFAYEREREYPHSGGVSVVRRSIAMDEELQSSTTKLLRAIAWHGVAMVEYKYDRRERRYTLMEINGRFQASTALCIDAGINLPHLAMCVHLDRPTPATRPYRVGIVERWLRGDMLALVGALRYRNGVGNPEAAVRALWHFVRDFLRASRYDEFSTDDWMPAIAEAWDLGTAALRSGVAAVTRVFRLTGVPPGRPRTVVEVESEPSARIVASAVTQRSMRA